MVNKLYSHNDWNIFSNKIKNNNKCKCSECLKTFSKNDLNVYHKEYIPGKLPWEYKDSFCKLLCKNCFQQSELEEINDNWILLEINDLGKVAGKCEKEGCNKAIRYEFLIYNPSYGYKIVGSTCIDSLTKKDQDMSLFLLNSYKKINTFIRSAEENEKVSNEDKLYYELKYNNHLINIYPEKDFFVYQIAIKEKGVRHFNYKTKVNVETMSLDKVKMLGAIHIMGELEIHKEKRIYLKDLYIKVFKNFNL